MARIAVNTRLAEKSGSALNRPVPGLVKLVYIAHELGYASG